jgi:DNA-binding MarR family transcriptional regulator
MAKLNIAQLLETPFYALVTQLHERLAERGYPDIRPAHGNVFGHIQPGGSRLTELAARAQITKQSMAYLVDYLETRGYVERIPDPEDGRAWVIRLTERGWTVRQIGAEIIDQIEAQWSTNIGEKHIRQLRGLLEELVQSVYQNGSE